VAGPTTFTSGSSAVAFGSSFGGVRELRFAGGGGMAPFLGISRRVMIPWPVVHRFVVTQ
jgi:hypothetical protein